MRTPDTAAVRSWAREQGLVVADRGRLPAEVLDAYTAAHREGPGSSAPAERAAAGRTPGPPTSRRPSAPRSAAQPVPAPAAPAGHPGQAQDDRRVAELVEQLAGVSQQVTALGQQVTALGERLAALEAAAAAQPARRFRFGK